MLPVLEALPLLKPVPDLWCPFVPVSKYKEDVHLRTQQTVTFVIQTGSFAR